MVHASVEKLGSDKAEASGLVYDAAAASGCSLGAELDCGDRSLGFNATMLRLPAKSAWFVCEMSQKHKKIVVKERDYERDTNSPAPALAYSALMTV